MATEPKTGLEFWPPGAMQPDLLFNALLLWMAAWAQAAVLAFEDDPPGSPADGDAYIIGTGTGAWAGHDTEQARWYAEGSIWLFFPPAEGYEVRNLDDGGMYQFDGSAWQAAAGGLPDAPSDGNIYGRKDAAWEQIPGGSGAVDSVNGQTGAVTVPVPIGIACSDETSVLTAGVAKVTFRMPFAMSLTEVRANLATAQAGGSTFTVDVNEGGASILSTKITIDNTEKTSTSASVPPVISDASLADDAEITVDIDQVGDGSAKGLKVWLIGYPS